MKYAENGADELLLLDTVVSLYGRNNLLNVVERVATKIGIPLTVAGGISTSAQQGQHSKVALIRSV